MENLRKSALFEKGVNANDKVNGIYTYYGNDL